MNVFVKVITTPARLFRNIIRIQEQRKFHFHIVIIFAIFTGVLRGLEEGLLFFPEGLNNSLILAYIPFYLVMYFGTAFVFISIGKQEKEKVFNVALIGLFLGTFPPVLDLLINQSRLDAIRYGYLVNLFTEGNWEHSLFYYYAPKNRIPLGEAITLWLLIGFAFAYIKHKSGSYLRAFFSAVGVYIVIFFNSYILPSFTKWALIYGSRNDEMIQEVSSKGDFYISLSQIFFLSAFFFVFDFRLFKKVIRRSRHSWPFVFVSLIAATFNGKVMPDNYLIAGCLLIIFLAATIQNDFYDQGEDRRNFEMKQTPMLFFNSMAVFIIIILFAYGYRSALPMIIIFALAILYNYPFYRGKSYFPTNLKIEGVWGGCAFLAGMLVDVPKSIPDETLVVMFLIWGGWSIMAAIKDSKDIRIDKRVGIKTVYVYFYNRGVKLKRIHGVVCALLVFCLLVPLGWFVYKGQPLAAVVLFSCTVLPIILVSYGQVGKKTFERILLLINVYLLGIFAILFKALN